MQRVKGSQHSGGEAPLHCGDVRRLSSQDEPKNHVVLFFFAFLSQRLKTVHEIFSRFYQ